MLDLQVTLPGNNSRKSPTNNMQELVVFTGAGLSAPSGIPTFRDPQGLWSEYDVEQVCHFPTWKHHATQVHEFHNKLRTALPQHLPNTAHSVIAEWSQRWPKQIHVFTQNVDDLLERAGCVNVIKLHGDLQNMQCLACSHVWHIGHTAWKYNQDPCVNCGECDQVKPGVIMFYEPAPYYLLLEQVLQKTNTNTMWVVIGTSSQVVDIASMLDGLPGVKILNNLNPTPNIAEKSFDYKIYQSAHLACSQIDHLVQAHMNL